MLIMITIPSKSPRAISATWFAFVAYLVVLIIFRRTPAPQLYDFILWQGMPIITAGVAGFSSGSQILNSEKVMRPIEAIVIGVKVSVISYFAYFLISYVLIVIIGIIEGQELRISWQIYSFFYITFYYAWLIILAGAAAGWILYQLFRHKVVSE
jgi:hypothetical protein